MGCPGDKNPSGARLRYQPTAKRCSVWRGHQQWWLSPQILAAQAAAATAQV